MAVLHFLDVGPGDCSIIKHASGRITTIDVCKARSIVPTSAGLLGAHAHYNRLLTPRGSGSGYDGPTGTRLRERYRLHEGSRPRPHLPAHPVSH